MSSDTLKSYLDPDIANGKILSEVFNVEGPELDALNASIQDIKNQFNIDTATWALDIYEKGLGITTDKTKDLDYRRSVIKAKSIGTGKLNSALIKMVCDSFTNGAVEVTFDGTIHVKFTSVKGVPPNMQDVYNAVEQIKPAYILLEYSYTYNTWNMVSGYKWADVSSKTWAQLQTV